MRVNKLIELNQEDMRGVMANVGSLMNHIEDKNIRERIIRDCKNSLQVLAQRAFDMGMEEALKDRH